MKTSWELRAMIRRIEEGGCWCEVNTFLVAQLFLSQIRDMNAIGKVIAIITHARLDAVRSLVDEIERGEAADDAPQGVRKARTVH